MPSSPTLQRLLLVPLVLALAACAALESEPDGAEDFLSAAKYPAAEIRVTGTRMAGQVSQALAKIFPPEGASPRKIQATVRLTFRETSGADESGNTSSAQATLHLSLTVLQGARAALKKDYEARSTEQPTREDALDEALGDVLRGIEKDLRTL